MQKIIVEILNKHPNFNDVPMLVVLGRLLTVMSASVNSSCNSSQTQWILMVLTFLSPKVPFHISSQLSY